VEELVVALDVGATNARARVAAVFDGGMTRPVCPDLTTQLTSARQLYAFAAQVIADAEGHGNVTSAAVAVAGPVHGENSRVTNWTTDAAVSLIELVRAGLPSGRTVLLNDVVAGAWGANARVASGESAVRPLRLPPLAHDSAGPTVGNLVYVAPGTGLGAAALVRHGIGPLGATAVGCESQHSQMPRFDDETGPIIDRLTEILGHAPSWEDLVSGRGLVHIYEALGPGGATDAAPDDAETLRSAREIAQAARGGSNSRARAASDAFYRTLGRFAQTLALTLLPCGVVVIGGASTERNIEMLPESGLAEAFVDHRRFSALLGSIPIYTVGGDVNIEGAVWLATRR